MCSFTSAAITANWSVGGLAVSNATEFCTALLEQAHVAIVSGDPFGAPGHVRLSFAASMETLTKGLDAIEEFLKA